MRSIGFPGWLAFAALLFQSAAAQPRNLTFEQRVRAQEAIERLYYAHQIGATRRFEEAVPGAVLEKKVRTYLKQSVALEVFWKTPVTSEMLRRELERMAVGTRMPERLRQLYAVLGNDPFLIQECLARPALVDRLARNFFAYDAALHATTHQEAEFLREDLVQGRLNPWSEHPGRTVVELVRVDDVEGTGGFEERAVSGAVGKGDPSRLELQPDAFERYRARLPARIGEIGPVEEEREAFVISVVLSMSKEEIQVATFIVLKLPWDEWWASVEARLAEASVLTETSEGDPLPIPESDRSEVKSSATCLADDTWDNGSLDDVPDPRSGPAVWTGTLMIVWGGGSSLNTGVRYDPATDSWTPTSTTNAPSGRVRHTAVWTGSRMVVWGGYDNRVNPVLLFNTGGRYDPATDSWTPTSTTNAPSARSDHAAVWTGSSMVLWGGYDGASPANTGGRYDPTTDSWTPTSTTNAPSARGLHTAVWTGSRMVVWGGADAAGFRLNSGGRYNPANDAWTATSTANAPSGRISHTAVWTGSRMVVWGGADAAGFRLNTGGRYNPTTDSWTATSTANAPSGRIFHTALWTGSLMVVWGGQDGASLISLNSGGRYNPTADTWTPTSMTNAPSGRANHTALWTGSLMVVWGGGSNPGGRYDPTTDTWTPMSTANAPSGRSSHTAVWTGSLMVVWGGDDNRVPIKTGGRYDPTTDSWTPTSTTNAPSARADHTAVWTGSSMVVWGGGDAVSFLNTGGRYDPTTDTWIPTSTTNAPSGRTYHTAVWTGSSMVVWGGYDGSFPFNTGGRYDPTTDSWTATSRTSAPSGRSRHTAVWTGSRMVVWGGHDGASTVNTGGRYDPATNSWTPTSTINAPSGRHEHTAVWTGSLMVVWGGDSNRGGRYRPTTDTWTATSTTNAPSGRHEHTAVWTGSLMVVWGGFELSFHLADTGGRYDPTADSWTATSTINAPSGRFRHSAVWTGSLMVVWGGLSGPLNSGGRYALGHSVDDDGDGLSECQGDCNDGNAAVYPGAAEVCDSLDNDCDGVTDNASVPVGTPLLSAQVSGGATLLSWSAVDQATAYDVVRGDLSTLTSSGGQFVLATQACLADDLAGTSLDFPDATPAPGNGFWYLVRAVTCGGHGTYDSGGAAQAGPRDAGINASPSSCS